MGRHFVIIGLGRLGSAMLETLLSLDHEMLGIDSDEDLVQNLSGDPHAHLIAADATNESVLYDLSVGHFDSAAVVIGENMEASILATANLKELGMPYVVARALNRPHARVLDRVGADRIIEPEKDMGAQLARTMASPTFMDYVDLGGDEALAEAQVPTKWVGKSLADLHLYRKSGLTVLALERLQALSVEISEELVVYQNRHGGKRRSSRLIEGAPSVRFPSVGGRPAAASLIVLMASGVVAGTPLRT